MNEKQKMMEEELASIGIHNLNELNEAIKKEKLDVTLMVTPVTKKQTATG